VPAAFEGKDAERVRRVLGVKSATLLAWAYNVVRTLGNYGEIYERNMGPNTPVGLVRGPNNLWSNGGLLYALPMR
jgi:hypothetical protein